MTPTVPDDSPSSIARDVAAIARISAVPTLLRIVCEHTGMRFAAVARVTDGTWTACAVEDQINFGLAPGGQLDVHTTLCKEARAARQTVVFDHASKDPTYSTHHTPRIYGIESYISVPIVRPDGVYFGNLCAIDPQPNPVSNPKTIAMFEAFAELIGRQLDLEQHQEEVESALLAAEEKVELREQFIAVLGHDLRNPLASMGAIAKLLVRKGGESADYGRRLLTSAHRMSRLIDDVLDFARIRLGSGMRIQVRTVTDLEEKLCHVVGELQDAHPTVRIVQRFGIDASVDCDDGKLQQLLSNLLGNAVAYGSATEPISIEARVERGWLELSVTNRGEPIPAAHLEKIFEPYWRPSAGDTAGLGLGLHICSQIVKAHGGTLSVTSTREAGTVFTARIPERRDDATVAA